MRTCTKCGDEKPLEAYSRDSGNPEGRRRDCKACDNAGRRFHYYANHDRELARTRARGLRGPGKPPVMAD